MTRSVASEPGWVDLDGTANTRDLGGLPVAGGRIRPGLLLRSDNLQGLTARDVTDLVDRIGVRTVLDLRTDSERADEGPGPLTHRPEVVHLPLSFIPDTPAVRDDPGTVLPSRWDNGPVGAYLHYLHDRPECFAAGVHRLADPAAGGAIAHCAAGKDRTGTFVALVLDLLGADEETIVADYAVTNERIPAIFRRLLATDTYAADVDKIGLDAHYVDPATMPQVLAAVRNEYGSSADYLRAAGVNDRTLQALRRRLVEPS